MNDTTQGLLPDVVILNSSTEQNLWRPIESSGLCVSCGGVYHWLGTLERLQVQSLCTSLQYLELSQSGHRENIVFFAIVLRCRILDKRVLGNSAQVMRIYQGTDSFISLYCRSNTGPEIRHTSFLQTPVVCRPMT